MAKAALLAEEFTARNVGFFQPIIENGDDGLRGFEIQDIDGYILFFGALVTNDQYPPS